MSAVAPEQGLDRFVPEIATAWDQIAPGASWHEVEGTLCFVDISGFTAMSERLARRGRIGAEELTSILNRVFGAMLDTAFSYGGRLIKFGGDALLLLFLGDDHPLRGASAAVAMQQALRTETVESTAVGKVRLRMSAGLHSGPIQLFSVGASHRELMITGPAGTTTTTMEHTAHAGEIVVSEATRDLLPPNAVSRPSGEGWILRWRKPPLAPEEHDSPRVIHGDVGAWIPIALRSYLAATRPEPEHRVVSVAFVRFCGVDEMITRLGPAAVADGLDQMVTTIQEAADEEGVTFLATDINEDGGKVLLVAGAPAVYEDDDGRLLRTARRIADADTTFDLHIGVNRGHVFAGEVGTDIRSTYTIIGDTVNVAARLCAVAWAGRIYVTPDVLERSQTIYATEPLEPLTVKGKAEPLTAYMVGDEIGFKTAATRTDLPFTGRAEEMARLTQILDGAAHGPAVVAVIGDTGIGKSRLVDEALGLRPDVRVVALRAEPYGAANPYRPLRDPLREVLGLARDTQPAMARALRKTVAKVDSSLLPLLPLLGDVAHIDVAETPETRAIEPRFRRDRLADTVLAMLEQVLEGPTVFVVEDGQWMDEASADLLDRIARATADSPWAMLVTRRPGAGGFSPAGASEIELSPLSSEEAEELVIAATEAAPLRPHEVAALVARAGGNPLFLEETMRVVREAGGTESLPDSLAAVMGTRIDALPPLSRRVLRYASVLGRSFRLEALRDLIEDEGIDLDAATGGELAAFLDDDGESRLRFRHALARDVAYDGLSFGRRRQLHLRAAEAAERATEDHAEDVADLLAMHYSLGGNHEKAWHFARAAGDQARAAYANVEAAANYERALDSVRRLDIPANERAAVWIDLGDVRGPIGLPTEALEAYRQASRLLADDPESRAGVQSKRALLRERAGAFVTALREITAGYRMLEGIETDAAAKMRAHLAVRRAGVRQAQQRPADAMALAEIAVDEARRAGEIHAEAGANMILHWAHSVLGMPGGTEYGERALELYQELGGLDEIARLTNNLGGGAYFDGRWDDAIAYYRQGQDAARRAGDVLIAAMIGANIGEVLVNQGRLDEAEPILRDAARVQRASGWTEGANAAERHLGRLLTRRGDSDEAERLLSGAYDDYVALGRRSYAVETGLHLAQCLAAAGKTDKADRLLADIGEDEARDSGHASLYALVRSEALASAGRVGEAAAHACKHIATFEGPLAYEDALLMLFAADLAAGEASAIDPKNVIAARRTLERLGVHRDVIARPPT